MDVERIYRRMLILKTAMFIIIVSWGAYVQYSSIEKFNDYLFTDFGGPLFSIFTVLYIATSYFLYKFRALGKSLFLPMIIAFIVLGFLTELINPSQFSKDIFYVFVFYIASPVFFVGQGAIFSLLYFTDIRNKLH